MSNATSTGSYQPSLTVPVSSSQSIEPSPNPTPYTSDHAPQSGVQIEENGPAPWDDLPPTYEEALAQDVAPVDGPRTDYVPPPSPRPPVPLRPGESGNEKATGIHRMPSERLFPDITGSTASAGRPSMRLPSLTQEQGVANAYESNSPDLLESSTSLGNKLDEKGKGNG